jgi:hypothetical protein
MERVKDDAPCNDGGDFLDCSLEETLLVLALNFDDLEVDWGGSCHARTNTESSLTRTLTCHGFQKRTGCDESTGTKEQCRWNESGNKACRFFDLFSEGAVAGSGGTGTTKDDPPRWVHQLVQVFRRVPKYQKPSAETLQHILWSALKGFPSPSARDVRSLLRKVRAFFSQSNGISNCSGHRMVKAGSKKDLSLPTRPILVKETCMEVILGGTASMVNAGSRKVPELPMLVPLISTETCSVVSIVPAPGALDNTKPASLDIIEPGQRRFEKEEETNKGRGPYKCGKCRVLTKGHRCPYKPLPKRNITESSLSSSLQASNDPHQDLEQSPPKKRKKGQAGGKYRCRHCGKRKELHSCTELAVVLPHHVAKLAVPQGDVDAGRHAVAQNNNGSSSLIRLDPIQRHVGNPCPVVPSAARDPTLAWNESHCGSPTTVTDEVRR